MFRLEEYKNFQDKNLVKLVNLIIKNLK